MDIKQFENKTDQVYLEYLTKNSIRLGEEIRKKEKILSELSEIFNTLEKEKEELIKQKKKIDDDIAKISQK